MTTKKSWKKSETVRQALRAYDNACARGASAAETVRAWDRWQRAEYEDWAARKPLGKW